MLQIRKSSSAVHFTEDGINKSCRFHVRPELMNMTDDPALVTCIACLGVVDALRRANEI